MCSVFSMKAVRLLLAVSVSIWIAGGCLFGCTGTVAGCRTTEPQTDSCKSQLPRGASENIAQFEAAQGRAVVRAGAARDDERLSARG